MVDRILRSLPDFKGKHFLANLLYKKRIESSQDILIDGKLSCSYLVPNLKENVGLDIFINGVYEKYTIDFLKKIIPANGCYLDLGANIGSIVIPLAKNRPDIKCLAVEAAPWVYEYLKKNVALNSLQNIELINYALFDKDDIELDFFSPKDKYGKGSLSPVFTSDAVKVITRKVDTILKNYHINKVDTIKIDVEGFEYFAFQGAVELLESEPAPDIVFEFVDWAERRAFDLEPGSAQELLISKGYKLFILEKDKLVKLDKSISTGSHNLFAAKNWH